ncbi:MAG: pyrroline-5-carboxylate reductase [Verrucomicrobiota bacterium]
MGLGTLGFIGAGRMATAILKGLLEQQTIQPDQVSITARPHPHSESKEIFKKNFPQCSDSWKSRVEEIVENSQTIIIAVKPQQIEEIIPKLKRARPETLIVSIAAGITLDFFERKIGKERRIIRTMPNTPLLLGQGVTAYAWNDASHEADRETVECLFKNVGIVLPVNEPQLNAVTALSGSGPAYFYLFIEALQQAAIKNGLDAEASLRMAIQTALGASMMLQQTGLSPRELIDQVKSKGGTTEAALNTFNKLNFMELVEQAFQSANDRSMELGQE